MSSEPPNRPSTRPYIPKRPSESSESSSATPPPRPSRRPQPSATTQSKETPGKESVVEPGRKAALEHEDFDFSSESTNSPTIGTSTASKRDFAQKVEALTSQPPTAESVQEIKKIAAEIDAHPGGTVAQELGFPQLAPRKAFGQNLNSAKDVTEDDQRFGEAQELETARDPELPDSVDENFQRSTEAENLETARDKELPDSVDENFQRSAEAQELETVRDKELPDSVNENYQRSTEAQELETVRDKELPDTVNDNYQRSTEAQELESSRDKELPDSVDEKYQRATEAQDLETSRDRENSDSIDKRAQTTESKKLVTSHEPGTEAQNLSREPESLDTENKTETALPEKAFDNVTEEFQTGVEAQELESSRDKELPDSIDENFQRSTESQNLETARDSELPDSVDENFQRSTESQNLETARDSELPDSVDENFQRSTESQNLETARDPELPDSVDENYQRSTESEKLETARDPELPDSVDENFQRSTESQNLETARDPELPDSVNEKFQVGKEAQELESKDNVKVGKKGEEPVGPKDTNTDADVVDTAPKPEPKEPEQKSESRDVGVPDVKNAKPAETKKPEPSPDATLKPKEETNVKSEKSDEEEQPRRSLASIRSAFEENLKAKKEPPPRPTRRPSSFDSDSGSQSSSDKPEAPERPARPARPIKPLLQKDSSDESPALVKKAPPPRPSVRPRLASQFEDAIKAAEVEKKPLPAKPSGRVANLQSALFADLSSALAMGPPGSARPKPKRRETEETEDGETKDEPQSQESADAQLSAMPANPRARARKGPQRRLPELAKSKLTVSVGEMWELAAPAPEPEQLVESSPIDEEAARPSEEPLVESPKELVIELPKESLVEPVSEPESVKPAKEADKTGDSGKETRAPSDTLKDEDLEVASVTTVNSEPEPEAKPQREPEVGTKDEPEQKFTSVPVSPTDSDLKIEPQEEEALREALHTTLDPTAKDIDAAPERAMPPLSNLLDKSIDTAPNQSPFGQSRLGISAGQTVLTENEPKLDIPKLSNLVDRSSSPLSVSNAHSSDHDETTALKTETSQERLHNVRERLWAAQEKHQAASDTESAI